MIILPPKLQRWERPHITLTNGSDNRSPEAYLHVVAQFPIDDEFYAPGNGLTWCNIFAWHLSLGMSCELPHWIRGLETRANDLCDWLEHKLASGGAMQGPELGWVPVVDELAAIDRASLGYPTFATWKNPVPKKSGHIGAVIPSTDKRARIAQAGKVCTLSGSIVQTFGSVTPIRFWTHD